MIHDNNTPVTEAELKAKATNPRVTEDQLEAFISSEHFFTAADGAVGNPDYPLPTNLELSPQLYLLTICVLILANGFTVMGQSACADPDNFDPEIGRRLARQDAKNKVWQLLGFELRTKLSLLEKSGSPSVPGMGVHVGTKAVASCPMNKAAYCSLRGWDVPANEDPNEDGYLVEYLDGGKPNVKGFAGYVSWSPKDVFDRAYGEPLRRG